MQGLAADPFEFEITQHIEYIGTKVQGKTMSHADPTTYGKVLETSKTVAAIKPVTPEEGPSAFQKFIKSVVDAAPKLINVGLGYCSIHSHRESITCACCRNECSWTWI